MTRDPLTIAVAHKVGDIVVPNPAAGWGPSAVGVRCVVTRVPRRTNEVNFVVDPCDADGNAMPGARGFKGRASAFVPASGHETTGTTAARTADVEPYVPNPPLASLVRPQPGHSIPDGLYVVTGNIDSQRVRIIRVGGDGGRYWKVYSRTLRVLEATTAEKLVLDYLG